MAASLLTLITPTQPVKQPTCHFQGSFLAFLGLIHFFMTSTWDKNIQAFSKKLMNNVNGLSSFYPLPTHAQPFQDHSFLDLLPHTYLKRTFKTPTVLKHVC